MKAQVRDDKKRAGPLIAREAPAPWTPLHPMHRELAARLTPFPPPAIASYSRPVRVLIATGLVVASWGIAIWSGRVFFEFFCR